MKLPVFSSSDGRTIIGYAEGLRSATVIVRKAVSVPTGWNLYVWKRSDVMQDCLELPEGYCYSIGR